MMEGIGFGRLYFFGNIVCCETLCRAYISGKIYPSFDGRFSFFVIYDIYGSALNDPKGSGIHL